MTYRWHPCAAAAISAAVLLSSPGWAAAPVDIGPAGSDPTPSLISPVTLPPDYKLDTEMVVRNWVLCVSQSFAEKLVHARETGADAALKAYDELKTAKSCGQFAELRVILQAPLYATSIDTGGDARAFEALVNLAGSWASAFVVSGSLPDQ
jgi:hypothetical protein